MKVKAETAEARIEQLAALGMVVTPDKSAYSFQEVNVLIEDEINLLGDPEWTDLINQITPTIEEYKKEGKPALSENNSAIVLAEQKNGTTGILKKEDFINLEDYAKKITNFKRKFTVAKLKVSDPLDKKQMEKLRLGIKEVRDLKTSLDAERKKKTEPYRDTVTFINESYDKLITALESILDPLKDHQKTAKEEKERKEKEEELKQEQIAIDRRDKFLSAGMAFDGDFYVIGNEEFGVERTSYGMVDIKAMTDTIFERELEIVKQKDSTIKLKQKEKEDREEKERLEKEENDRKIKQQNAEMAAERIESRTALLKSLGMEATEEGTSLKYNEQSVTLQWLGEADREAWNEKYTSLQKEISEAKEQERLKKEKQELYEARSKELIIDLNFTYRLIDTSFNFDNISTQKSFVETATADEWKGFIEDTKQKIAAAEELKKIIEARLTEVLKLGFTAVDGNMNFSYKNVPLPMKEAIEDYNEDQWNRELDTFKETMAHIDQMEILREERKNKITPYLLPLHNINASSLHTLKQDEFDHIFEETKKSYEEKLEKDRKDLEEKNKKEAADKLAKSSDEQKWKTILEYLKNVPAVDMESEDFKFKHKQLLEYIAGLK